MITTATPPAAHPAFFDMPKCSCGEWFTGYGAGILSSTQTEDYHRGRADGERYGYQVGIEHEYQAWLSAIRQYGATALADAVLADQRRAHKAANITGLVNAIISNAKALRAREKARGTAAD